MIEAYAFLAAFALQILVASVLSPARFIRFVRGWARDFGSERFTQLYPDADYSRSVEQFVTGYRAVNIVIAAFGLVVLGRLFNFITTPEWAGEVMKPTAFYFFLQMSPLVFIGVFGLVRYRKLFAQPSQETKRTAILQRRGLFDFVSPFLVVVAVLSYVLFVAYSIYLDLYVYQNDSLSKSCYIALASVTLVYALNAFIIYKYLYGRKNPLVTHEGRVHTIGMKLKGSICSSIAVAWFISLMGTLGQPGLEAWRPFALSFFFVITTLLSLMDVTAPNRPKADGVLSSSKVPS